MSIKIHINVKIMTITSIILLIFVIQFSSALYLKRSTGGQECSRSTPCGWEVYSPFIRTVNYFVASPCQCGVGYRCVRVSDDISISAYVHRCRREVE